MIAVTKKESLTTVQAAKLARLENQFENGLKQSGKAMKTIRDERLYREFGTFDDYCLKRWNVKSRAIILQIEAHEARVETGKILPVEERKLLPALSDSTARELAKMPPRKRVAVFKRAVKKSNGEAPTARAIVAASRVPCQGVTQEQVNQRISDAYGSGPVKAASSVVRQTDRKQSTTTLTLKRVLDAYDAEINENLKHYGSLKEMAVRVRVVLSEL